MTPHGICSAVQRAVLVDRPTESDHALVALHKLLVQFLQTTAGPGNSGRGFMRDLSIEQVRLVNQLFVAAGL